MVRGLLAHRGRGFDSGVVRIVSYIQPRRSLRIAYEQHGNEIIFNYVIDVVETEDHETGLKYDSLKFGSQLAKRSPASSSSFSSFRMESSKEPHSLSLKGKQHIQTLPRIYH